ncbi:13691_t:CDS:2, partial [Gigaspora margarita]
METDYPMFNMVTNHLTSLSDSPVETVHRDNALRQHFVNTVKYPYTPKQLHTISKKCAIVTFGHVQEDISSTLS